MQSNDKPHNVPEEHFDFGPFSSLLKSVRINDQILVSCRNNKKILGTLKAFDRHLNLVLENVCETWTEKSSKNQKPVAKERFYNKLFLRGDSVILIVPNLESNINQLVPNPSN